MALGIIVEQLGPGVVVPLARCVELFADVLDKPEALVWQGGATVSRLRSEQQRPVLILAENGQMQIPPSGDVQRVEDSSRRVLPSGNSFRRDRVGGIASKGL